MINIDDFNFRFSFQKKTENSGKEGGTEKEKLVVIINDLMSGGEIDFTEKPETRWEKAGRHLFDKKLEVKIGARKVYVWKSEIDNLRSIFQKTLSGIFENCKSDEDIDGSLAKLSEFLQGVKPHEYTTLPANFLTRNLGGNSQMNETAIQTINMLGKMRHRLASHSSNAEILNKIYPLVMQRLDQFAKIGVRNGIKSQFLGPVQAGVDLSHIEVSESKFALLDKLNNNNIDFNMIHYIIKNEKYNAPLRKVDRAHVLNEIIGQIDAHLVEKAIERVQRFLNPRSWDDFGGIDEAFQLLFFGGLWSSNLNKLGPREPEKAPEGAGDHAHHQVFGPRETRIPDDYPGNRIEFSGGVANALSAPQHEDDIAKLLRIVGESGGYITRLSLSGEAPGKDRTYMEYVPKKLGETIRFNDIEVTLSRREMLPIEGEDPTQYVTLDRLTVKKGDTVWDVPVYTYHNFQDLWLPDPKLFSAFIERTEEQKGLEYVHCKGGSGRTGTYLLSKYSDRTGGKPKLLQDFRSLRSARSKDMVQSEYQMAFVFGLLKSKVDEKYKITMGNFKEIEKVTQSKQRPLDILKDNFLRLIPEKVRTGADIQSWEDIRQRIFKDVDERVMQSFLSTTTGHVLLNTSLLLEKNIPYSEYVQIVAGRQEWLQKEFGLGGISAENLFRDHSDVVALLIA